MDIQRLYSHVRRAIYDYNMIEDGDKIAIGISGGKDSLTLLYALAGLRKFYPKSFELCAISVDLGYEGFDLSPIKSLCEELEVPYYIVSSEIKDILEIKIPDPDKAPCSLCAKLRKGALNEKALELGCNKIAYAHHKDDLIETAFLSLLYEGRFHCFSPVTPLVRSGLTLIRPLLYVTEAEVIGFRNKYQLPCVKNPCPYDGNTKREYVKNLIRQIQLENPGAKNRIFNAVITGNLEGWPRNER